MLTVEDFARIRRAYRDGESVRSIAKRLHHSRRKVREALAQPEPREYALRSPRAAPKLDPYVAQIEEILAADERAPRKQRHTGTQVFRRLREAGYAGGYDQVRRYLSRRGRQRVVNTRYAALASHYNFEPLFCMPARGNEKPRVENRVKTLERWWGTPVPRVRDLPALNDYLRECCLADRQRSATGQTDSIEARFQQDRAAALSLPAHAFDPCLVETREVDKYQTVLFDHNRYSVPHSCAFRPVSVKAYVDRLDIVAGGQVVAQHLRSYGRGEQLLNPLHYLVTLERKPTCLDHAPVYRDWRLPASFLQFREILEKSHGTWQGSRQFVRVLQLLRRHPLEAVSQVLADGLAREREALQATTVIEQVERLFGRGGALDVAGACRLPEHVPTVEVPRPDLKRFDQLLLSCADPHPVPGEPCHADPFGSECEPAAEVESQTIAVADHARGT